MKCVITVENRTRTHLSFSMICSCRLPTSSTTCRTCSSCDAHKPHARKGRCQTVSNNTTWLSTGAKCVRQERETYVVGRQPVAPLQLAEQLLGLGAQRHRVAS